MNSQTSEALASLSQRFDAFQLELADVANCLDALIVTDG